METKLSVSFKAKADKNMPEQGEIVMLKFANILSSGSPESLPKLDGGKWLMILKPKNNMNNLNKAAFTFNDLMKNYCL